MKLLLMILSVFFVVGGITFVYAENTPRSDDISTGVFNEEGKLIKQLSFYTYDRIEDGFNKDGSKKFVPYILEETNDVITLETADQSYRFWRNLCSVDIFDGGKIDNRDPMFNFKNVLKQAVNGTDIWSDSPENESACVFSVNEENGKVIVTASKDNFDTVYDVRYAVGSMEWTYEWTNTRENETDDNKFGFTFMCEGASCNELYMDGERTEETFFEKNELITKNIEIDGIGFDTKNDEHDYVWAMRQSKDLLIVDFTHAKDATLSGEKLVVDPLLNFTSTSSRQIGSVATTATTCSPTSDNEENGVDFVWLWNANESGKCYLTWFEYNITDSHGRVLSDVDVEYDVIGTTLDALTPGAWIPMTTQPTTATTEENYDAARTGTPYVATDNNFLTVANGHNTDLGSTAFTHVESAMSANQTWFGLATRSSNWDNRHSSNDVETILNNVVLKIAYAVTPPDVVTNIQTTSLNTTNINIQWTAPVDFGESPITEYEVNYSIDGGSNSTSNPTTPYFNHTGLTGGTMVDYYISACNVLGCGPFSEVVTTQTLADAPTGLVATTISDSEIQLDWDIPALITTVATGGIITEDGDYKIHTFNTGGTFNVTQISTDPTAEYLVIGGGGGGSGSNSNHGRAGGGAGQLIYGTGHILTVQPYTITVANGGTAGNAGGSSIFDSFTAIGGGTGGQSTAAGGGTGASGGGGGSNSGGGGTGTAGWNGGSAGTSANCSPGGGGPGGGGGAGGVGGSGSGTTAGNGGVGLQVNITGTNLWYAGGGAGGFGYTAACAITGAGTGGSGVGGNGGNPGTAPVANTGSGAGGGGNVAGATGVVIIRYLGGDSIPINVEGYKIFISDNGGSSYTVLTNNTLTDDVTFTADSLTENTEYYFKIAAWNLGGLGANSTAVSELTFSSASAPLNLVATTISASQIDLTWDTPADDGGQSINGYRIYRESPVGGGFSVLVANTTNTNTYYNNTSLATGSNFNYIVQALTIIPGTNSTTANNSTIPTTPANLVASSSSPTTIDLEWDASSGNDVFYKIERESPIGNGFSVIVANQSAITFEDESLAPNTEYNYQVTAFNQGGSSSASDEDDDTTPTHPPTALTATATSTTEIDLNWAEPEEISGVTITGYQIYIDPGTGWELLVNDTGSTNTFGTVNGLESSSLYDFIVAAWNEISISTNSTSASNYTLPDPPTSLTAEAVTDTWINILFEAPSGTVEGYKIEYESPVGGGWSVYTNNTESTNTSYPIIGLSIDTEYNFRVSTWGPSGISTVSNTANATTLDEIISILIAVDNGIDNIDLSWSNPSAGVNGFKIERESPVGGGFSVLVANTTNTDTTYNDAGLNSNTQYNYRVSALIPEGVLVVSNEAADFTNPGKPTSLTVTQNSINTGITVSWTAPSGTMTGYKIERNTNGGAFSTIIADTGSSSTSYTDTSVSASNTYTYKASAIRVDDEGLASNPSGNAELIVATVLIEGENISGPTVRIRANATAVNGVPDLIVTKVEYYVQGEFGDTLLESQIVSQSIAKGVEYDFPYIIEAPPGAVNYYAKITISKAGIFTTNVLPLEPLFTDPNRILMTEVRDTPHTLSTLSLSAFPVDYDVVFKYFTPGEEPFYFAYDDIETFLTLDVPVDSDKRYYIAAYINPTFDYEITDGNNATATIPNGYPVTESLTSHAIAGTNPLASLDVFGDFFGLPMAFIFIIALASIFTARTSQMGIIFVVVAIGIMLYMGIIDFESATITNAGTWAAIIIVMIVGVFLGKKWD